MSSRADERQRLVAQAGELLQSTDELIAALEQVMHAARERGDYGLLDSLELRRAGLVRIRGELLLFREWARRFWHADGTRPS